MRHIAKIYKISEVAEIPVNGADSPDVIKADIEEIARKFPEKLRFREPKKDEKFRVEIEQVG